MRQLKYCKPGHFVMHEGTLYQLNCLYTDFDGTKSATLIQPGDPGERKSMLRLDASVKVEHIGPVAKDSKGRTWVFCKISHFWSNRPGFRTVKTSI